ncbi:hypothetical protein [Pseudonocardia zijingensis]|uniref:hypothetical protein n=1 Tax=Pseudonocardia zijingensis TaxID=153376 RepID=UPI0031DDA96E
MGRPTPPDVMSAEAATAPIAVRATPRPARPPGAARTGPAEGTPSQNVDGRVAATIIAAGVGCAAFGVAVVLAESISVVKQWLTLSTAVGPLSGKAVAAVVLYPVVWLVLHAALRKSQPKITTVTTWTTVLLTIGLLGTFPPVYGMIAGH